MFNPPALVIPENKTINTDPQSPIFNLLRNHNFSESNQSKNEQLVEIQEHSYFTSQPESPSYDDIKSFKEKMDQLKSAEHQDLGSSSPQISRKKSQRLQDQQIIVVEEQNQTGSNFGDNQSLIIEHIDFNEVKNDPQPEQTPRWDLDCQNKNQQKFPGNFRSKNDQPPWMVDDQSSPSSSPRDFQFESSKMKPIRNSKNTCVDRQEFIEMSISNKSCIAKPMGGQKLQFSSLASPISRFPQPKQTQNFNINQILNRWDNQIYPQLQNIYLQDHLFFKEAKTKQESNSKLAHLKQSMKMKLQLIERSQESKNMQLIQEIERLKYKLSRMEQQNQKLKRMLADKNNVISTLKMKQRNMGCLHIQTHKPESQELSHEFSYRLNNIYPNQNPTPTFLGNKQMPVISRQQFQDVLQSKIQNHDLCLKHMEDLQEYIFDIEQKLVGIDIEVQKRVKIIGQHMTSEFQQKLQQQITKMKQTIQGVELEKQEIKQKFNKKEQQLKARENQLQQLYKQLQSQRKNIARQREREKISLFNRNCQQQATRSKSSNCQHSSAIVTGKFTSDHFFRANPQDNYPISNQIKVSPSSRSKKNRMSAYNEQNLQPKSSFYKYSKRLISDDPQHNTQRVSKSLFNDFSKYSNRACSRMEEQDSELLNINNKIQRIKSEINRQICSIK